MAAKCHQRPTVVEIIRIDRRGAVDIHNRAERNRHSLVSGDPNLAFRDLRSRNIEGKRVLDAVGGLWNVTLGYSCDPIKKAIRDQLNELPYYSGFRGVSTGPAIELAYELTEWFKPEGMVRAFFTSGGSDSVETALRLARQFW